MAARLRERRRQLLAEVGLALNDQLNMPGNEELRLAIMAVERQQQQQQSELTERAARTRLRRAARRQTPASLRKRSNTESGGFAPRTSRDHCSPTVFANGVRQAAVSSWTKAVDEDSQA